MTQLPTFFSEPMDMPHTYINDGNFLYFCSEQETKGCARSANIFRTYNFELYPEQITKRLVRRGVTYFNGTLLFPLKKQQNENSLNLCGINNDTFHLIATNVPKKFNANLMTIVSNKAEGMEKHYENNEITNFHQNRGSIGFLKFLNFRYR